MLPASPPESHGHRSWWVAPWQQPRPLAEWRPWGLAVVEVVVVVIPVVDVVVAVHWGVAVVDVVVAVPWGQPTY